MMMIQICLTCKNKCVVETAQVKDTHMLCSISGEQKKHQNSCEDWEWDGKDRDMSSFCWLLGQTIHLYTPMTRDRDW
jgi:hypothetical protein